MRRFAPYFLIILLAAFPSQSFGRQASLTARVRAAEVIVVGNITDVTRASGSPGYDYDTAHIAAIHVLKGSSVLRKILGQTKRIPLSFPSIKNSLRVSTDIRYQKGQKGIWLLTLKSGRLTARHCDALQPMSRLDEIKQLVEEEVKLKEQK